MSWSRSTSFGELLAAAQACRELARQVGTAADVAPTLVASRAYGGSLPTSPHEGAHFPGDDPSENPASLLGASRASWSPEGTEPAWGGPALRTAVTTLAASRVAADAELTTQ
ncbi:hypothetical protein [Polaromonas sp. OV174]|uniref:hypothetical protein n=1 Tax=Polaromonas sp. OV174 TaxID=1855300 RepID=UPI00116020A5|nr:hypothetical protein [Polaromonas sp. OV174]